MCAHNKQWVALFSWISLKQDPYIIFLPKKAEVGSRGHPRACTNETTRLTEYRHKMRSGDLPAHLFLHGPSNGSFMLWMLFCSILAFMSSRWRSIMFLVLFCFISVEISEIQLVCDRRTDGRTDGRTDRRTDTPSYRDARTHLKRRIGQWYVCL